MGVRYGPIADITLPWISVHLLKIGTARHGQDAAIG